MRNLLNKVLTSLIRRSRFQYRIAQNATITNEFGQMVATYGDWIEAFGIVEPGLVSSFGSKNLSEISYKDLGLDPTKSTITAWLKSVDINNTVGRNACDQIRYRGKTYNIVNIEDWLEYDGWKRCYCQEVIGTM